MKVYITDGFSVTVRLHKHTYNTKIEIIFQLHKYTQNFLMSLAMSVMVCLIIIIVRLILNFVFF